MKTSPPFNHQSWELRVSWIVLNCRKENQGEKSFLHLGAYLMIIYFILLMLFLLTSITFFVVMVCLPNSLSCPSSPTIEAVLICYISHFFHMPYMGYLKICCPTPSVCKHLYLFWRWEYKTFCVENQIFRSIQHCCAYAWCKIIVNMLDKLHLTPFLLKLWME